MKHTVRLVAVLLISIWISQSASAMALATIHHHSSSATVINGICLDRNADYNPSLSLHQAVGTIADQIDDLVHPDQGSIPPTGYPARRFFIWSVSRNTYDPKELRLSFGLPGVPGKPAPPNPNLISQQGTLTALERYETAMKAYKLGLARAAQIVHTAEHGVLTLTLPVEHSSTEDEFGCIQRASEAHVKTLTIASTMAMQGTQQVAAHHSLPHVKVRIIDFLCGQTTSGGNQARVCVARKAFWLRAFARSGTTNVAFFFPGQPVGDLFNR